MTVGAWFTSAKSWRSCVLCTSSSCRPPGHMCWCALPTWSGHAHALRTCELQDAVQLVHGGRAREKRLAAQQLPQDAPCGTPPRARCSQPCAGMASTDGAVPRMCFCRGCRQAERRDLDILFGGSAPADQVSTPYVYFVEPSKISGARYLRMPRIWTHRCSIVH